MTTMNLLGKEHYDLLEQFERDHKLKPSDREQDKAWWKRGYVYSNGEINKQFIAYRSGYTFGKLVAIDEHE